MNGQKSITSHGEDRRDDSGFTLVEILIAIVLVGILSAVVVVGISNLTSKGSKSACNASLDAAKAATVVYWTASPTNAYPTNFTQLTTQQSPTISAALELPSGVGINTTVLAAPNNAAVGMLLVSTSAPIWYLRMYAPAVVGNKPTFVCS